MAKQKGFWETMAEIPQAQADAKRRAAEHAETMRGYEERRLERERMAAELAARMEASREQAERRRAEFDAARAISAQRAAYDSSQRIAIDSLLASQLSQRPFRLQPSTTRVIHPVFDSNGLEQPSPKPTLEVVPAEPVFRPLPPPQGLSKVFGKRQHAEAEEAAKAEWQKVHQHWKTLATQTIPARNQELVVASEAAERERQHRLAVARDAYAEECAEREKTAKDAAAHIEAMRARVLNNERSAVVDFAKAVFQHAPYPETFVVGHEVEYDPESREATVEVRVPPPNDMPSDSKAQQKARYNAVVPAVALRTLFELFRAEPEVIETASLVVGTEAIDPATGQVTTFRFVAAAAAREDLSHYDLSNVDTTQALTHMGALVSKNPFLLKPISDVRGIRK